MKNQKEKSEKDPWQELDDLMRMFGMYPEENIQKGGSDGVQNA